MGGSGSIGWGDKDDVKKLLDDSVKGAEEKDFGGMLSVFLDKLLTAYNNRDNILVKQRIEDLRKKIGGKIEGTLDNIFGGSVSKHTYVDGLSDIDSLLIVNKTELVEFTPKKILNYIKNILSDKLHQSASVKVGKLAITIKYSDGMEIQLLPALKTKNSLKISDMSGNWSKINPSGFQRALTKANDKCGSKLVPVIKLAKAITSSLPQKQQLSGYHIESVAIEAFKEYKGDCTSAKMLPHFFSEASKLIKSPIKDKSGQSVRVDEHLGRRNSSKRKELSHILNRISKRMSNASASMSLGQWKNLFEL